MQIANVCIALAAVGLLRTVPFSVAQASTQASEIYHIFNDFLPHSNGSRAEYSLVWRSWKRAKAYAAQLHITVHHVGVVLSCDTASIPAAELYLGRAIIDPDIAVSYGKKLATVFGTLSAAFEVIPKGALVMFTNRCV